MRRIDSFRLEPGERINGRYQVVELLGEGWEGEVYLVKELSTGIERAAKFFFPHRNPKGRASRHYAKQLHKLRDCGILIHYHTQDEAFLEDRLVTFLVSEFIEGELLSEFVARQPGKRVHPFVALHLLHALAVGMEQVHALGEYHGDLHTDNIIVQRAGLGFELKLLDLLHHDGGKRDHIREDVAQMVELLYEITGGARHYAAMPEAVKRVVCGRKRSLFLKKFRTAGQLKAFLERLDWD